MSIDALVVTYNRVEKLQECVNEPLKMNLKNIFIVDNASNDSTQEFLKKTSLNFQNVTVFELSQNIGGAGGFNYGIRRFIEQSSSEYLWVMDDDTIPSDDSLEKMVSVFNNYQSKKKIGFVTGSVHWIDGNLAKMNIPVYSSNQPLDNEIRYVNEASFVAILFSRKIIENVGLPIKEFFIWGDDVEYTKRITDQGYLGIQMLKARILHKMKANNATNILNENDDISRINRYFYDFRNRMFISKRNGVFATFKTLVGRFIWLLRIICSKNKYKGKKVRVLLKGTLKGLLFNPAIESGLSIKEK